MVAGKRSKIVENEFVCSRCKKVERKGSPNPPKSPESPKEPVNNSSISYLESVTKVSDQEAVNGFEDEDGEKVYIVEDVLKYSSDGKFFVKWQGYPKCEGSWLLRKDMPKDRSIKEKMLKLKKLYQSVAKASQPAEAQ